MPCWIERMNLGKAAITQLHYPELHVEQSSSPEEARKATSKPSQAPNLGICWALGSPDEFMIFLPALSVVAPKLQTKASQNLKLVGALSALTLASPAKKVCWRLVGWKCNLALSQSCSAYMSALAFVRGRGLDGSMIRRVMQSLGASILTLRL